MFGLGIKEKTYFPPREKKKTSELLFFISGFFRLGKIGKSDYRYSLLHERLLKALI